MLLIVMMDVFVADQGARVEGLLLRVWSGYIV